MHGLYFGLEGGVYHIFFLTCLSHFYLVVSLEFFLQDVPTEKSLGWNKISGCNAKSTPAIFGQRFCQPFRLHCSFKKVVEETTYENLKVIKNTLPNNSGNSESLKK